MYRLVLLTATTVIWFNERYFDSVYRIDYLGSPLDVLTTLLGVPQLSAGMVLQKRSRVARLVLECHIEREFTLFPSRDIQDGESDGFILSRVSWR